jgi:hypothetical protein
VTGIFVVKDLELTRFMKGDAILGTAMKRLGLNIKIKTMLVLEEINFQ